jgi:hypothetical protein
VLKTEIFVTRPQCVKLYVNIQEECARFHGYVNQVTLSAVHLQVSSQMGDGWSEKPLSQLFWVYFLAEGLAYRCDVKKQRNVI